MFREESQAHPITPEAAEHLALQIFAVTAKAEPLPGEYDCNFRLEASDGRHYVLKCMHPAREAAFVELQWAALSHLARNAPHLPLPRVQKPASGPFFVSVKDEHGQTRFVWLLSFLAGSTLAAINPHAPEILQDLGRFLGELDSALLSFSHPATHRELKWDSARALWIRD